MIIQKKNQTASVHLSPGLHVELFMQIVLCREYNYYWRVCNSHIWGSITGWQLWVQTKQRPAQCYYYCSSLTQTHHNSVHRIQIK